MSAQPQATAPVLEADPAMRVIQFIEKFDASLVAAGYTHADRMKIVGLLWDAANIKEGAAVRAKFTPDEMFFMLTVYKNPGAVLQISPNDQWVQPEEQGMVKGVGPLAWLPTEKLDQLVCRAFGFSPVMLETPQ